MFIVVRTSVYNIDTIAEISHWTDGWKVVFRSGYRASLDLCELSDVLAQLQRSGAVDCKSPALQDLIHNINVELNEG